MKNSRRLVTIDDYGRSHPAGRNGHATSLIALARNLGAGIGISVFTAFVVRRERFHQTRLAATLGREHGLPFRTLSGLQPYLRHQGDNSVSAAHQAMGLIYHQSLQHASALSYLDGFRIMAVLLVITVPFVWIMRKPRFKSGGRLAGWFSRVVLKHNRKSLIFDLPQD